MTSPQASPEQLAVYESRGRRLKYDYGKFEALRQQVVEQKQRLEQLIADGKSQDAVEVQLQRALFEAANLALEKFDATHDSSGVSKGERFGQDIGATLQSWFEPLEAGAMPERPLRLPEAEDLIHPVFILNMGELDRLNSSGAHDVGDQGLSLTAAFIENTVLQEFGSEDAASAYEIYRLTNNDFAVRFSLPITKQQAEKLRTALTRNVHEQAFTMPGGIEPPPTAADYLSLEEAVALLPPDVRIDKDGGTVAIQYLKDFLFTYNEASKITQRYERLHLLLQSGSEDAAQELYEKHLRKTLAGALQVDSFADFKRVWKELGDNHQEVSKRALEYALQAFHEQSAERNERVEKLTEFIRNKAEREKGVAVSDVVRPIKKLEGVPPAYEVPREQPFKKPDPQAATYGLRGLQEMKTSLEKRQNRVQQLEGQGGDPQVLTLARQELSNEQERLSIQEANRDRATGFEQRGSMFRLLEESFETKKSVGVLYADLAFLKYFDKVGGRQTGDLAILKAAEIFDQVRTRAGEGRKDVTIECYRLGGDEFAFAVSGDFQNKPEELEAVLQGMKRQLRQAAHEAGAIPSQAGAAPGYYDTELSISMGSHVYASEEQGIAECAANDLPLKPEEEAEGERLEKLQRNKLAETLVLVADKMVEIDKSFQRFLFLLDQRLRKNMASGKAKAALESQYAQLESYSQKAIFKEGKRKLDEWEERIKTDPETITELYKEILEYVTERVIAHARELQGESFDARRGVELLVRYRYLETREHELEQTITDLRQKLKQDDAKIEVLQLQLQQAEREQAVIRDLRGDIQKTASKAA